MKLQEKLNEFKKELRNSIINQEIPLRIEPENVSGYNGCIYTEYDGINVGFSVADTFVCYYNKLTEDMFSREDIKKLNEIIKNSLEKHSEKVSKIRELQYQIDRLRKEIGKV